MANRSMHVLVFGSTGFIGKHITNAILDASHQFASIGIFTSTSSTRRKPDVLAAFQAKGAKLVIGDIYNEHDVSKAYQEYDTVISALGRDAIEQQITLIRLAESSGTIQRFFPSEFGTDVDYSPDSRHEAMHQAKLAVRDFIQQHVRRLEHTYVVTGPYGDGYIAMEPAIPEIGSFDVKKQTAYLPEPAEQKISWTAMPDVGRFVVAALLHREAARDKALKVQSFVASHVDILAEFEAQMGCRWDVVRTSAEKLAGIEAQAWKEDSPLKATCSLRRLWLRGETIYPQWDNAVLGHPEMVTLGEIVRQQIAASKA